MDLKPIVAISTHVPVRQARAISKMLAKAGYLPVIADPEHIKTLEVSMAVTGAQINAVMRAALEALRETNYDSTRNNFAKKVIEAFTPEAITLPAGTQT